MSLPARWWLAYPPPTDALGIAAERLELQIEQRRRDEWTKNPAAGADYMRRLDATIAAAERIRRERGDPPWEPSEAFRLACEHDPGLLLRVRRAIMREIAEIRASRSPSAAVTPQPRP